MKKVVSLALVCLFVVTMLASCSNAGKIVGSWTVQVDDASYTYTFNEDGTGKIATGVIDLDFTWEAKGSTLTMIAMEQTINVEYSIKGNQMTIIGEDGAESIMTKQ